MIWNKTVTHALSTGLETTVTPVMTDSFLRPVIRSVMDSAAVTTVTVMVVSRMADGKMDCWRFIWRSQDKHVQSCSQVSFRVHCPLYTLFTLSYFTVCIQVHGRLLPPGYRKAMFSVSFSVHMGGTQLLRPGPRSLPSLWSQWGTKRSGRMFFHSLWSQVLSWDTPWSCLRYSRPGHDWGIPQPG